ncbi:hypothetical protein chiPu_0024542, partial [Chiloscyllium punctatum]|nr:hypothetical protein [Chiloscyllium punctatum]
MAMGDDVDGISEQIAITSVGITKDPDHLYNIMFVGNANAGKTSFIQRFSDDSFEPGIPSTV